MIDESSTLDLCGVSLEFSKAEERERNPWEVTVTVTRPGRGQERCQGSLVSPYFVLTAAHCFTLEDQPAWLGVDIGLRERRGVAGAVPAPRVPPGRSARPRRPRVLRLRRGPGAAGPGRAPLAHPPPHLHPLHRGGVAGAAAAGEELVPGPPPPPAAPQERRGVFPVPPAAARGCSGRRCCSSWGTSGLCARPMPSGPPPTPTRPLWPTWSPPGSCARGAPSPRWTPTPAPATPGAPSSSPGGSDTSRWAWSAGAWCPGAARAGRSPTPATSTSASSRCCPGCASACATRTWASCPEPDTAGQGWTHPGTTPEPPWTQLDTAWTQLDTAKHPGNHPGHNWIQPNTPGTTLDKARYPQDYPGHNWTQLDMSRHTWGRLDTACTHLDPPGPTLDLPGPTWTPPGRTLDTPSPPGVTEHPPPAGPGRIQEVPEVSPARPQLPPVTIKASLSPPGAPPR
ncbi:basic proline-rich protein-like [Corvus hawaiiensis]|uniref:basic proline-rich protein-like n=1 Tax=Corvus hawaiiensis TaxID=134902 RepID=UPI00201859BB|nr:basic proline-rich protein-like [Corvus hawaiiensis]